MASKQRAEQWAEHRRQRDGEERRQRMIIITEFGIESEDSEATMHALKMLEKALGLATIGAPFGVIGPGPHGRPRSVLEMPDVTPPAA